MHTRVVASGAGHGEFALTESIQAASPQLDRTDGRAWLLSPSLDFWLASAGASGALLAAMLVILWHGDGEIDAFDLVLSELHLGATYHAVLQRRLWRRLPVDVLLVPLVIVIATYALALSGQSILLTTIAMYAAVWHRGRQSFGVARFYQRAVGGPISRVHECLFRGSIYLPMAASTLAYTHLAPTHYEGEPYLAPSVSAEFVIVSGLAAAVCVGAYLLYVLGRNLPWHTPSTERGRRIHHGEWWVSLAHAVAFASSYIFGASNAAFLFVVAVHHEVQYLHFTYAVSRRKVFFPGGPADVEPAASFNSSTQPPRQSEWRHAAGYSVWPVLGLAGAVAGGWLAIPWLVPLGIGGLFCHYWLDGRIWTRQAMRG